MTIRDRFIEEMARKECELDGYNWEDLYEKARHLFELLKSKQEYRKRAERIFSIKLDDRYRLAIVDEKGELPDNPYGWDDIDAIWKGVRQICDNAQQDLLKQNYVKEIK